jgi:uncharacterized protein
MADTVLQGGLQLEIDGSGLEAKFIFTPKAGGEEWNREKIFELLSRNQITAGIDTQAIEELLKNPPKKPEAVTVIAAKGVPVEPAKDEEVEWKELTIPEDLAADAEQVLSEAGAPEIIQVRVEKIKKQQKVEKKQKLGFLPAKEEVVTVVEKKEIPEKIEVDPAVQGTGWVAEGDKIAVVYAGEPGVPGKDIYGNQLMPEKGPRTAVYPGKGVEKKRGELTALQTGFLRRGKNWVEVIPFQRHEWSVHLSEDQVTCQIDFTPGSSRCSLPDSAGIIKAAEELGADSETLLSGNEISLLLKTWKENGKEVKNYSISSAEDGIIDIEVAEDNMKAVLNLKKGRGSGKVLQLKDVGGALRTSGVKGFQPDKVKADILEFYRSPRQALEGYVLAEGVPPEEPETPELEITVKRIGEKEKEEIQKLLSAANSTAEGILSVSEFPVDSTEEMAFVVRHQPIAHFTKVTPGKPGKDVYGRELPCEVPPKPVVNIFENIKEEEEQYIAEISGLLEKAVIDKAVFLRVRPHRDAEVRVTKADENMKGYLTIAPAEGAGRTVSEELLWEKIKDAGITRGLKDEAVSAAAARAGSGEAVEQLLIAEGQPPKHTTKNQINFHVDFAQDSKVTIKKDGSADYKNVHQLTMVQAGQTIADVEPPEEVGEDGWDITGKTVPARSFQGFDLELGANVDKTETEGGGFTITAKIDGKLIYDKKKIDVEQIHVVAGDVNLASGNIKFNGSVQIKGNVESGFTVISGDSIQIGGSVDGALISADGEIVINQGVKGGGKAVIRTKDTIKAGFVEHARLLSVKDVLIKNFCLRSIVKCNGRMKLLSDKGHFIGGSVRSRYGIEVMNLGSDKEVKTEVFFGQDYLIADQIEIEEREIQKIKDKLLTFDVFMLKMEKQGERQKLEQARKEKLKLMKIMEKRSLRLFTFREKFEEHFPSEVKVKGTLFPGVVIESHGRYYETKQKKKNVSIAFNLDTGQLEEE